MSISIIDPYNAAEDLTMPTLRAALSPNAVDAQFNRKLKQFIGVGGSLSLHGIEVTRHKPGKRCVVEYRVSIDRPGKPTEETTLIGKVRSKRFGKSGYRTLKTIWDADFQADSRDGISVPDPIGTVGKFQMWLQRKVPGQVATELLTKADGPSLGRRIAEASHKLHQSNVVFEAVHDMDKELRILRERLPTVYELEPCLRRRIDAILAECDEVAASVTEPLVRPIHRDFYSDQIIVNGDRLYLLDFDLGCQGSPAVDIGNFIAHLTEQSVREYGSKTVLRAVETSITNRFLELNPHPIQPEIHVYRLLTLVRHIYLSTVVPERRGFTETMVDLCEDELTQWWRETLVR